MELGFTVGLGEINTRLTGFIDRVDVDMQGGIILREFKSGSQWRTEVRCRVHCCGLVEGPEGVMKLLVLAAVTKACAKRICV